MRINRLDELMREQCTDMIKLATCKDGLNMDMEDLKRYNDEIIDLLLLSSNENSNEDQQYFDSICNTYLECCADVKTKIQDLTQERQEMLSQRSRTSNAKSCISRLSNASAVSSRQAAAALKEKMASLKKQQEMHRTPSKRTRTKRTRKVAR